MKAPVCPLKKKKNPLIDALHDLGISIVMTGSKATTNLVLVKLCVRLIFSINRDYCCLVAIVLRRDVSLDTGWQSGMKSSATTSSCFLSFGDSGMLSRGK